MQLVGIGLVDAADGGMDAARDLDVVVAIDAEDLLDDIDGTGHIDLAGGHIDDHVGVVLLHHLAVEALQDVDGLGLVDDLACHLVEVVELQIDAGRGEVAVFHVLNLGGDGASCQFFHQHGSAFQCIEGDVRVGAAFVAERGVGLQAMVLSRLTDAGGVEVGAFEEDVGGLLGDARLESSEHAGDAHGLFGIADHQVASVELALYAVQGDEWRAFGEAFHDDLLAGDFISVKDVHGLTDFHQHVVGDIHDVVDAAEADGGKAVLEPLG